MSKGRYVVYEEVVPAPIWMHVVVWGAVLWTILARLRADLGTPPVESVGDLAAGGGAFAWLVLLPVVILVLLGRLTIRVTRTSLWMGFGLVPFITKLVALSEIESMEAVTYSPLREFGGWGVRWGWGRKKRAWTMRGNEALVLQLTDGTALYVGSLRPKRLAEAIRRASRPDPGDEE